MASIGLTQIAVGSWLNAYSLGTAALVSQPILLAGVSDIFYAIEALRIGYLTLGGWVESKAISLAIALGSAGLGYGIAQAQTATKTLHGVQAAVQNPGYWNTQIGRQGLIVAAKRVGLELGKGLAKECVNTLIDYGIDTTLIPAIEQKILQQVTKQITQALKKNDLVIALLAQDVQNRNNYHKNWLIKASLQLLAPEKNSKWLEISQTIAEGIISNQGPNILRMWQGPQAQGTILNQGPGIALILQGTKMVVALQKIYTMTSNFLTKFDQQITTQYEAQRQTAPQQTQTTQQQAASPPNVDKDQIEVHPVHIDQDCKSDLLSAYDDTTPSSISQLVCTLSNTIASQMTQKIQGSIIRPITHTVTNMGIDYLLKDREYAIKIQEEEYQAKGDVHQVGEQMAKEKQPQSQQATDDPQDAQATSDGPSQTDTSQRGGLAEVGAAAQRLQRPIALYDEHGRLINIIGRNLPGKPIKIQHTPSSDGTSGHWESYGTDTKAIHSGKNNCFYDAIACQVPDGMSGAQLRGEVAKCIANSKYATDLQKAVKKLEVMNPGALRRGGFSQHDIYYAQQEADPVYQAEQAHKAAQKSGDPQAIQETGERLQAAIAQQQENTRKVLERIPVAGEALEAWEQYKKGNTGQAALCVLRAVGESTFHQIVQGQAAWDRLEAEGVLRQEDIRMLRNCRNFVVVTATGIVVTCVTKDYRLGLVASTLMSGAFDRKLRQHIADGEFLKAADQFTYHCLFIGPSRRLCEALIEGDAPGAMWNCGVLMLETLPWLKVDGSSVLSKVMNVRPGAQQKGPATNAQSNPVASSAKNPSTTNVKPNGNNRPPHHLTKTNPAEGPNSGRVNNQNNTNGNSSGTTKPGPQQRTVDTTTPSLEQQARNIKHLMNRDKNTVTVGTPSREIQYDLAGRAHRGVPTPHKQYSNRNVNRKGEVHFNKDKRTVEPFDQQDIRTVKEALKRREKKDNKEQSATTKDNKEQPTTKDNKEQPTTKDNKEQPTTKDNKEQPTTKDNKEQPTTKDNKEQPTTKDNKEQPTTKDNKEQPNNEGQ